MTPEDRSFEAYREHPTEEALRGLLRTHEDRVYNLSYQVLRHAQDAEDAAQNALLKVARGASAVADATGFRHWLYRITLTTALDVRSERSRRRARERVYALSQESPAEDGVDETGADLCRALGSLEEDLRDLVIRHYYEKSSLRRLAAREGCSPVAVWKKIEKAKTRLREELLTLRGESAAFALEGVLGAIHPVTAPGDLVGSSLAAHAALGSSASSSLAGGIAMASKGPTAAKLIAAMIFLTTLGVGGGFAAGLNRGRAEVREVEDGRSKLSRELAGARSEIARLRGDLFKVGPAAGPGSSETASAPPPMASAPGTAKASEKRAGNDLRENLRRIVRTAMAARKAGKSELSSSDPEMADPELQKAMMALMPYFMASQDPARAPEKYAELFSAGRDVLLEELGFGLSSAQKESLQVSSERIRDVLSRAQNAPLSERGITRLEAEREFLVGLRDVITPDQWARWSENQGMSLLAMLTSDSQSFKIVSGPEDAESVAKSWAARYRLDDAQELAARACARPFAESVTRFDREFSAALGDLAPGASGGSPPNLAAQVAAYDYRIQVLRAQLDTLGQLRGLLGPEAGDRIQSTSPMEFVGPGLKQALGGSAKK